MHVGASFRVGNPIEMKFQFSPSRARTFSSLSDGISQKFSFMELIVAFRTKELPYH